MNALTPRPLLIHDYCGHGFTAQLARSLARRGHRVSYLSFAEFATPKGRVGTEQVDPPGFEASQVSIGQPFDKDHLLKRSRQERIYADCVAAEVRRRRPAVVISANSPLVVQRALQAVCKQVGARFVFWMQDVQSEAIGRILGRKNALLGRLAGQYFRVEERRLLQASDSVVVISEDFRALLDSPRWHVRSGKLEVVENWGTLDDVPLFPRDNDWATANFRPGRQRIAYSGTLARKHDPEILVRLAQQQDADVYLFSSGSGPEHVRARATELGLGNLFVRPWVSNADLPKMLAGADLLCAFIEADAGVFSVPSKVLSYLAAGRPILAAIPGENLAARTIRQAEAGLVSEPGDDVAMQRNGALLLDDAGLRERLGRNGRAHAEAAFDIERIAARFEGIFGALGLHG